MTVDFNHSWCESFVTRMQHRLSDPEIVRVWSVYIFGDDGLNALDDVMVHYLDHWDRLSCWNKQQVLFLLAPIIECIASAGAMRMASRARTEEPL